MPGQHPKTGQKFNSRMTLEEARNWIRKFDEWFKWNTTVLTKKDSITQRVLLENFLDNRMLSKIKSDVTVTDATLIVGPNGLLKKLVSYYTDDLPMNGAGKTKSATNCHLCTTMSPMDMLSVLSEK